MKFSLFMKNNGYKFLLLRLQTKGNYSKKDSEWNYSDIPHLNYVHTKVDGHSFYSDNERIVNLFMQKFGPFSIPVTNYIEHLESDKHFYVMNILGMVVSITTSHKSEGYLKALTNTEYKFYYRSFFEKFFAFLIRFATRRNYKVLMSEDVPMRQQRGNLRKKGIVFLGDKKDKLGFAETENLNEKNVDARNYFKLKKALSIELFKENEKFHIKELFLSFVKNGNEISILGEICQHEGANLQYEKYNKKDQCRAACPWHGMIIRPLKVINSTDKSINYFNYLNQKFSVQIDSNILKVNII